MEMSQIIERMPEIEKSFFVFVPLYFLGQLSNTSRLHCIRMTQTIESEDVHSDDSQDGEHQLDDLQVENDLGQALIGASLTLA